MSSNYEKIAKYYAKGIYKLKHLKKLVGVDGGITAEEFQQITGQLYQ